jgi:hypothetical protein
MLSQTSDQFRIAVEVENWSGKSSLAICQDFHAKVFTLNLTAVLTRTAQAAGGREARRR